MRFGIEDGVTYLQQAAAHGFPLQDIAAAMNADPDDLFLTGYSAELDPRVEDDPLRGPGNELTRHVFELHARGVSTGTMPFLGLRVKGYTLLTIKYGSEYMPNRNKVTVNATWRSEWIPLLSGTFAVPESLQ